MAHRRFPEPGRVKRSPGSGCASRRARWALGAWILGACASGCTHRSALAPGSALDAEHREPDLIGAHHVVEPGQTLFQIAHLYGVEPEALARANGIADAKALEVGQDLAIPDIAAAPRVSEGMGTQAPPPVEPIARPPGAAASAGKGPSRDPNLKGDLEWPLRGVLYARFGRKGKEAHDGIDLAAPLGTPIKAARPGKVLYAGDQKGYGLIAIIEHSNGLTTLYAHNRDLRVKTGQQVRDGQVIATVGESGRTTGPHLHFEVRKDGVPVDPLDHLGAVPR